jgi:Phospholipase_D-nuclease N-terminal
MGLLGLLITIVSIAAFVYWLFAMVEVLRIPSWQFYEAGSNKIVWVCIVFFLEVIGALLWLFLRRDDVLSVEDWSDEDPPADWYMDDDTGALRWWDGVDWTDRYQTWTGARPRPTG